MFEAECIMSDLSGKSSMIVRICGRSFIDLAGLRSLILFLCASSTLRRDASSHSELKVEPSIKLPAISFTGSQALSMSTLGLKTCAWSKMPLYGPRSIAIRVVVFPMPLGERKHHWPQESAGRAPVDFEGPINFWRPLKNSVRHRLKYTQHEVL